MAVVRTVVPQKLLDHHKHLQPPEEVLQARQGHQCGVFPYLGYLPPLRQAGSTIGGSKQKQIGTNVQPLEVDTLRPLVDLAYWSTFLEVRRDCAAAFATLSMNEANLQVLSQAGALGALLALIGVGNNRNDSQVHRNAATALSHLVKLNDIKFRLLKSPNGLKALFYPDTLAKRGCEASCC